MTETTAITCYYCKKEPADGEDDACRRSMTLGSAGVITHPTG